MKNFKDMKIIDQGREVGKTPSLPDLPDHDPRSSIIRTISTMTLSFYYLSLN